MIQYRDQLKQKFTQQTIGKMFEDNQQGNKLRKATPVDLIAERNNLSFTKNLSKEKDQITNQKA